MTIRSNTNATMILSAIDRAIATAHSHARGAVVAARRRRHAADVSGAIGQWARCSEGFAALGCAAERLAGCSVMVWQGVQEK